MINIWDYYDAKKIKVTTTAGNTFEGYVVDFTDREERSDLEKQEDGVTIESADGQHIEFYQSEIAAIEEIRQPKAKAI